VHVLCFFILSLFVIIHSLLLFLTSSYNSSLWSSSSFRLLLTFLISDSSCPFYKHLCCLIYLHSFPFICPSISCCFLGVCRGVFPRWSVRYSHDKPGGNAFFRCSGNSLWFTLYKMLILLVGIPAHGINHKYGLFSLRAQVEAFTLVSCFSVLRSIWWVMMSFSSQGFS